MPESKREIQLWIGIESKPLPLWGKKLDKLVLLLLSHKYLNVALKLLIYTI